MLEQNIALFPISVDNRIFTTENVISALTKLNSYATILIFIADGLQLYNRAIWASSEAEIWSINSRLRGGLEYLKERKAWLSRLKQQYSVYNGSGGWKVVGVGDITCQELVICIRNLNILFDTSIEFRRDVIAVATEYVLSRRQICDLQKATNLSVRYILEEMACNLVLKTVFGARDEYYMGSLPAPLVALYARKYGVGVSDLSGRAANAQFRFFTWGAPGGEAESTNGTWRLVSDITVRPSEAPDE